MSDEIQPEPDDIMSRAGYPPTRQERDAERAMNHKRKMLGLYVAPRRDRVWTTQEQMRHAHEWAREKAADHARRR
jgi:hypothetical protein